MEENCYAGGVMNEHEKSEITFDIVCEYGKLVETVFVSGRFWSMGKSCLDRVLPSGNSISK